MSNKHIELARRLRPHIEKAAQSLCDNDALESVELYPKWVAGSFYDVGCKVQYVGILYRCLTAHVALESWNPSAAPSLWVKILTAEDGSILPWEQPDSTNPYSKGDKVTHNGKIWVSNIDGNVWEPGVYGWTEVTE